MKDSIIETDVLIIGAGLSGLALHYYLQQQEISVLTIEARDRLGGRILTDYQSGQAPVELGATWLGEQHRALRSLIEELGLQIFPQELSDRAIYEPISTSPPQLVRLPPNDSPSYRIAGGTSVIIDALQKWIPSDRIILEERAERIIATNNEVLVHCNQKSYKAKKVVSTLPPKLFSKLINVEPALPDTLVDIMSNTHTWMSTSIKIGLRYPNAFWRADNLSGTMFSNVGPISELYDHSDYHDKVHALKGFLNNVYHTVSTEERKKIVTTQLSKYYGALIEKDLFYLDMDWSKEKFTHAAYPSDVLPHQHNGHEVYQKGYLNNRLFFGGTETAQRNPGYMEGAVYRSLGLAKEMQLLLL